MAYNGCYSGVESKVDVLKYVSGSVDCVILDVESNMPDQLESSAVIENLIIDGKGVTGTVGVLLENVYNCLVRNVTIVNCDVGIRVRVTDGFWSHGNRFEHIRMKNVKTGIVFEGTSGFRDFSYTTIDDVRISLDARKGGVGIQVGGGVGTPANLHCAFIKATVWLGDPFFNDDPKPVGPVDDASLQKGLAVVAGELRYSLVNLEVEQIPVTFFGYGVWLGGGATVLGNQDFMLTAMWLCQENHQLYVDSGAVYDGEDITVRYRDNA